MAYQSFEDLAVWNRAMDQAVNVFETFAECRKYTMRDQMERCAVSVPSNIAEGQERDSPRNFIRFLRISKGSNGELRTQLHLARRLGLVEHDVAKAMIGENKEIASMLQGLVRSIERA
jgi:four helix bundle protein